MADWPQTCLLACNFLSQIIIPLLILWQISPKHASWHVISISECLCHPHARSWLVQQPVTQLCLPRLVTKMHRVRPSVKGQYAVLLMMIIPFCGMPSAVTRAALDGGLSSATIQTPEQTNYNFLGLIHSPTKNPPCRTNPCKVDITLKVLN